MNQQGSLFTEKTTYTAAFGGTEPHHHQVVSTTTFAPAPHFESLGNTTDVGAPVEEATEPVAQQSPQLNTHDMLQKIVDNISNARKLEGLLQQGPQSVPVFQTAQRQGMTIHAYLEGARTRKRELNNAAYEEYQQWITAGAAIISLMAAQATPQEVLATQRPLSTFVETYYGSKAAERRRVKLVRRIKK